jgi:hypothetical protein
VPIGTPHPIRVVDSTDGDDAGVECQLAPVGGGELPCPAVDTRDFGAHETMSGAGNQATCRQAQVRRALRT